MLESLEADLGCIVTATHPLSTRDIRVANPESLRWYAGFDFAPVDSGGRLTGLLGVRRKSGAGNDTYLETLCALGTLVGAAIARSRSYRALEAIKLDLEDLVTQRTRELTDTVEHLKEAQAQMVESESQALLGRLAAGVLHELNTPVGVLRSTVDTMDAALASAGAFAEQHASEPEAADVLRALRSVGSLTGAATEASVRVEGLLSALRRVAGLDEARFNAVDVRRVAEDVLRLLAARLRDGPKLVLHFASSEVRAPCYPAKLSRVLWNVMTNAIEAAGEDGSVEVGVSKEGKTARIEVRDDGPGIPPDRVDALFEFGLTQKRGRVGMSFGLPLSKRYVEELGGTLRLDSSPGKGTAVTIDLPLAGEQVG